MIDIENLVVNTIENAFTTAGKSVLVLSQYEMIPESFPCCMIREVSHSAYVKSMDNQTTPHHAVVAYQIDIFSNKDSGAKTEVKDLTSIAFTAMCGMKFVLDSNSIITNEDRTIVRGTSRYSAIVQEGKTEDGTTVHQMYRA